MAQSKCPKCENLFFEAVEIKIAKANYRKYAVQCSKCGCVISILPFQDTNALIAEFAKKLNIHLEGW